MDTTDTRAEVAALRKLLEESRLAVYDNGKHFIAWGVLMSAALAATFALAARGAFGPVAAVWAVAILAGWVFSVRAGRSDYRRAPVRTLGDRFLSGIWIGFGVTATLIGLFGPLTGTIPPAALSGSMSVLVGGAFFASGFLEGLGWLRFVGGAWWLGGMAMLWWPGLYTLLVMAAMVLALQVVPGLVLRSRATGRVEASSG